MFRTDRGGGQMKKNDKTSLHLCPKCHFITDDDWPLAVGSKIIFCGCQDCWEDQCNESLDRALAKKTAASCEGCKHLDRRACVIGPGNHCLRQAVDCYEKRV